ncbi:MAG TPA: DUF6398 domain-containing protein [Cyclobacteriaceae bacterium]|nr:DUF6398 domain-containing protein [Cyclobacteriaceae bacterium]
MDKQKLQERQELILDLVRKFCAEKLNEEYFTLSERLVRKLGRKRNNPLVAGQVEVWAAAIIHVLGTINFLFDKASQPYSTVDEIHQFFGTKKATTTAKSKIIRDLLKLGYFDREFSTGGMKEANPLNKMVMVNGLIVQIDTLPAQYQEIVRQARAEGRDVSFTTP